VVEVTDTGEGFDPDAGRELDPEELAEGGLGIAIIRALADEFEITDRNGGGSRLRFVKHLGD
jgi:anti-sigma regulatory factor (Ser/Thr protein kinase)